MSSLFQNLPPGPLDIVGDVHGEIDALVALRGHLGYDAQGRHPDGRHLVFAGDLTDRGPDSPAVVALVEPLVASGRAWCVLGNHELNLVRQDPKDGSGWAYADDHDRAKGRYLHSRQADTTQRAAVLAFFARLPLALERDDLRVVHACWDAGAVDALRRLPPGMNLVDRFHEFEAAIERDAARTGLKASADGEERRLGSALHDRAVHPPMAEWIGRYNELRQMGNPFRIVTSGVERLGAAPFYSSGKWRFVDRVAWWKDYHDTVPVVVGHYWRWPVAVDRKLMEKDGVDLFQDVAPSDWLGPRRNVYCVDFSVGRRFRERELGMPAGGTARLAALRWPEKTIVFDDGEQLATS